MALSAFPGDDPRPVAGAGGLQLADLLSAVLGVGAPGHLWRGQVSRALVADFDGRAL